MKTPTSDRPALTAVQRKLIAVVATGAVVIAAIGFVGSYAAVRELALEKDFGKFAMIFPIGIDLGIIVLLALDLLLTWLRMPLPMLRHTAWLLTAATIAFNAAAAWPDPVGVGMHSVIPVLFVVVVEAARHATGRIADITADKHMEGVRLARWLLSPLPTFLLWRRMKLWELRSYEAVIALEQQRLIERARLRAEHGRRWRWRAPYEDVMALRLTRYGRPLGEPITAANIERLPVAAAANTGPLALETSTFQAAADQAVDVVREPDTDDREQPNAVANTTAINPITVREQLANNAVTSSNSDREQPSMADLAREHVALHENNSDAVRAVIANMPGANKASVAAAVRRERRKFEMDGGYG